MISSPVFRFELGVILATPGVRSSVPLNEILRALDRHHSGDWGDLCPEDVQENEQAVNRHLRLLSAYVSSAGVKFWIITEADRSATTALLPEEY